MNTGNRVLWTLIGLILLAAGVLGALFSLGRLRGADPGAAVLGSGVLDRWRQWDGWATAALVLIGLVLALLGLMLLRAQFRSRVGAPMPDLVETGAGRTRVRTSALTRGLARDLHTLPGVRDASAHLAGEQQHPELLINLSVDPGADLDRVHRAVDEALLRFTATSGLTPRHVDVDTRLLDRMPERVR